MHNTIGQRGSLDSANETFRSYRETLSPRLLSVFDFVREAATDRDLGSSRFGWFDRRLAVNKPTMLYKYGDALLY